MRQIRNSRLSNEYGHTFILNILTSVPQSDPGTILSEIVLKLTETFLKRNSNDSKSKKTSFRMIKLPPHLLPNTKKKLVIVLAKIVFWVEQAWMNTLSCNRKWHFYKRTRFVDKCSQLKEWQKFGLKYAEQKSTCKLYKKASKHNQIKRKHWSYTTEEISSVSRTDFLAINKIEDKLSNKVAAISKVNVISKISISHWIVITDASVHLIDRPQLFKGL